MVAANRVFGKSADKSFGQPPTPPTLLVGEELSATPTGAVLAQTAAALVAEREKCRRFAAEIGRLEERAEKVARYQEKVVVTMGAVIFVLLSALFCAGCWLWRLSQ